MLHGPVLSASKCRVLYACHGRVSVCVRGVQLCRCALCDYASCHNHTLRTACCHQTAPGVAALPDQTCVVGACGPVLVSGV